MRLYLVRHGESEGNVRRVFYGRTDYPLTDKGRAQAADLGERLRGEGIARCLTSPLSRAAETARLISAPLGLVPEPRAGLAEQDMGDFEDRDFEAMRARFPGLIDEMLAHWSRVVPPGGESFGDMRARVAAVLDEAVADGRDTLLVAHNGSLSVALGLLLELPDGVAEALSFAQGRWTAVSAGGPGRNRLLCFNR